MPTEAKYNPKEIEAKWQQRWLDSKMYQASDRGPNKHYVLVEFPYLSGEGLHIGHCLSYIAQDIIARLKRMQGHNVLYPIGWDAFGLPTENYAIKNNIKPHIVTERNVKNFKRQVQSLGISFDWSREINTADPAYYKWTQWIFLQLFKNGLAEKKETPINWCPKDKIGLAFEEVTDGRCERCGSLTERRLIKQWVLKITKYADRLIKDLEKVDYLPEVKQQQINWIGRSEGAEIKFEIRNSKSETSTKFQILNSKFIEVFTTRPDTLFGATYLVLAPEHEFLKNKELGIKNYEEVRSYVEEASHKTDRERQESKEKTGVKLEGVVAINPANKKEIPVWVADYISVSYGTGAVMAVPAHDERDFAFAKKFKLPIVQVIDGANVRGVVLKGTLMNSGVFNGMDTVTGGDAITKSVKGSKAVHYKLRDWIFSRQRYWGEPIPIIICERCGYVPLREEELPLELPHVERYEPTDTGASPLANISSWVNVTCPKCTGAAKRETDTMPNWAGSSWYFLRYVDPRNNKQLADKKKLKYWLPVDLYNGGAEHTTLHLLYSRFWHKFLYDIGVVPTEEPYRRRVQHGMILGPDGQKMSKSRGNIINPDPIVERYGADTFRLYMMFMGEYDKVKIWSHKNLQGVWRFMNRLWQYATTVKIVDAVQEEQRHAVAKAAEQVLHDIERRSFNTTVSHFMVCLNALSDHETVDRQTLERLIILLAPFVPHLAEEIWQSVLGHDKSVHTEQLPQFAPARERVKKIAVQINGKVRAQIEVAPGAQEKDVYAIVVSDPRVQKYISDTSKIKKFIYVKDTIVSIVV